MSWFDSSGEAKTRVKWRSKLKWVWKGKQFLQRGVKGMCFTTVVQVPSTKNSVVVKSLARIKPVLAKTTGYNSKIVKESGVQIIRLFDRVFKPSKCHSEKCEVCRNTKEGKYSKCRVTIVVYKAECIKCESTLKNNKNGCTVNEDVNGIEGRNKLESKVCNPTPFFHQVPLSC